MIRKTLNKWAKSLLKLVPLQNVIIFESESDFCDNSRALFEYMMSEGLNKKYRMIWLVENPDDFKGKFDNSVKFIRVDSENLKDILIYYYYTTIAKYAFYSHRTPPYKPNKGEVLVNLWHGNGPKNTKFHDMGYNFDYVTYSSDCFKKTYIDNFSCRPEQLLTLGKPRNDLLFENNCELKKITDNKYEKVIMWMPTFRTHKNGDEHFNVNKISQFGIPIIFTAEEFEEINGVLKEKNILLIIKLHPSQKLDNINRNSISNIIFLTNEELFEKDIQLYSLLGEVDALMTDISSVYVDYLLTNKPMAFTVDDMDEYKTGVIFENPLDFMPGRHMASLEDIKGFIVDMAEGRDEYCSKRMEINKLMNQDTQGQFSKKIVEFFNIK